MNPGRVPWAGMRDAVGVGVREQEATEDREKGKVQNAEWAMTPPRHDDPHGKWQMGPHMADGTWQMANGTWHMANGKLANRKGKWQMPNRKWQMANGKWQMANWGWVTN